MRLVAFLLLAAALIGWAIPVQALSNPDDIYVRNSPEGFWQTEDGSIVVEIDFCSEKQELYCGFIRALLTIDTDAELAQYSEELCGLPLLSNLAYEEKKDRWSGGQIFDPETEIMYNAFVKPKAGELHVRAFEGHEMLGQTLKWVSVAPTSFGCEPLLEVTKENG